MYEEYIKENKIWDRTEEEHEEELVRSLIMTKKELELANQNFEYADGDLIDYYTYQIKAYQAKLDYLLKKIKKKGILLDMVKEKDIRLNLQDDVG